jgi:hypothetical protein
MKKILLLVLVLGFCVHFSFGQNQVIGPIVKRPVYFDVSPPLRDMIKNFPAKAETSWKDGIVKNHFNIRPKQTGMAPGGQSDPNLQTINGPLTTTDTTIQNFDGNTNTEGYIPPDTYGDVGPNDYFQVVNCHYSIYSKTGTLLAGPSENSSVWSGMPNNSNDGDAVVVYDEQADRWLFSQFSFPNGEYAAPYYQMIAVSQTPDPTGSWYRWEYSFSNMPDYPKFAVWGDGYYMSAHQFVPPGLNWGGCLAAVYNRTQMLAGNSSPTMVMFTQSPTDEAFGWLPSDCDGPFPTGTPPNYYVYWAPDGGDHIGIYEFHVDWINNSNSTFGNFLSLPVNSFTTNITGIPQSGTTRKLDPINDRTMYRLQFRKFSTYWSMVTNHTVDVSSTVAGIRWYEIRKTTGAWSIYQQSTYGPTDSKSRWMGSIAQDTSGNIALGFSISSSSMYPSIHYTGRFKNDPLNTMTLSEKGIYNGAGSQTSSSVRWGDYSSMTVDPGAPNTFWYTQEYYASTSDHGWKTRIASFSMTTQLTVIATATPAYINIGQTSQLNATATGGTTYTWSWTSIPAGFTSNQQNPPPVSPTVSTKYIAHVTSGTQTATDTTEVYINMTATATANPYTINSGGTSVLNVNATGGGGTGTYTYSWTSNPAGFTSTSQSPTVSPSINTIYTAVATSGTQNASDTAKVKVNMTVLATATPPNISPGQSSQLNAIVTGGSGTYSYTWTSIPVGFNSNIQNPVVTPTVTTQYIVNVNDGIVTKGDTVTVTVSLNPLVVVASATPSDLCVGSSTQLNAQATGGSSSYTYSWTSDPAGFNSNIQNPTAQPTATTTYIVHVNDGFNTASDSTTVTVQPLPTVFAGNDTTVCVTIGQIQLNGQSTNSSSVVWTTSGDGTFLNPNSLTAIYYPGPNDKSSFHVNLTLTASSIPPCTPHIASTRHITFDPCTGIQEGGDNVFSVSIRPNPSFGYINVAISGLKTGNVSVNIMDLSGKVILQEAFEATGSKINHKIDLSQFQKGIYFVKVETDTQVKTEKLIME